MSFLVVLQALGIIAVGATGYWSARRLGQELNTAINITLPALRNIGMIDMYHDGLRGVAYQIAYSIVTKDEKRMEGAKEDLKDTRADVDSAFAIVESKTDNPEIIGLVKQAREDMGQYLAMADTMGASFLKATPSTLAENLGQFDALFLKLEKSLESVGTAVEDEAGHRSDAALAFASSASHFAILLLLASLIACTGVGIWIARGLIRSLRGVSAQLGSGAQELGSAVEALSGDSQSLAGASTQQAAALQQTSAAVEEISSMVKMSSEVAKKAEDLTIESKKQAEEGGVIVTKAIEAMGVIRDSNAKLSGQVNHSNARISEIVKVIEEIGAKTMVINDIVFQTRLLSFNASVEAARAGEHGKGFAVVAEEVGNLARMSGDAAKEITNLLEKSTSSVRDVVSETKSKVGALIEVAQDAVASGDSIVQECGVVLSKIVQGSSSVQEMVSNIAQASLEQSRGVIEISKAVQELDNVTQTNSMAAKSCAESSQNIAVQVTALRGSSSELEQVLIGDGKPTKLGREAVDPLRTNVRIAGNPRSDSSIKRAA